MQGGLMDLGRSSSMTVFSRLPFLTAEFQMTFQKIFYRVLTISCKKTR